MAIGWWTALKVIPWGQVIEHAPVVLKGARRLMERQRSEEPPPAAPAAPTVPADGPLEARTTQLERGLAEMQARLDQVAQQQRQGDELLAALAEQNARLVATVDVLRQRLRLLLGAVGVLAVGGALLAWQVLGG